MNLVYLLIITSIYGGHQYPFYNKLVTQNPMEPITWSHQPSINGNWQDLQINNPNPQLLPYINRYSHATFYFKNALFMYGGQIKHQPLAEKNIEEQGGQKNMSSAMILSTHFFKLSLNNKQWTKLALNLPLNHSLSYITNFGHIIQSNFMYIFGGQNFNTRQMRPPELIIINLDTLVVKKLQTKGSIPNPCINGQLLFLNKGSLLLFGGQTSYKVTAQRKYTNDIYVYKLDSRTWIKTQDNYKCKLPTLINPFLLPLQENQLYLFGGNRQIVYNNGDDQIHTIYNPNFYKLKPVAKITSQKPDVLIRNIYCTNQPPSGHLFTRAFCYLDKYIVCLSKKNEESDDYGNIWFFDAHRVTWAEIKQDNIRLSFPLKCSQFTSFVSYGEKIFTIQKDGRAALLMISHPVLEKDLKNINEICPNNLCNLCASKKLSLNLASIQTQPPLLNAKRFKQNFDNLKFPFSAMGLLVDNAVMTGSKNCNIYFGINNLGKQNNSDGNKFIIVEDNGQANMIWNKQITSDMFIEISRSIFVTGLVDDTMAEENIKQQIERSLKDVDKKDKSREKDLALFMKQQAKGAQNLPLSALVNTKTEKDFEKQHIENLEKRHRLEHKRKIVSISRNRKKYITNLKAAGVRLGQIVVFGCKEKYVQSSNDPNSEVKQIRRYILMVPQLNQTSKQLDYIIYSYMTINGTVSDPKMEQISKHVGKEYKRQLKIVTERMKSMNNVVYIGNLKKIQVEDGSKMGQNGQPAITATTELQYRKKYNDIFYGDPHRLNSMEAIQQIQISECCDISLKAYLSLMYLKQDQFTLAVSVKQNPLQVINSQPFLQQIDKMAKSKKIIDLADCFEFGDECNIVEIYWNPDGWKADHGPKHTNVSFVLNGVLIYHQGRLISRYKTEMGDILDSLETDSQLGCMFGYIEVKDLFPVNMLKTDFTHPGIMEKYYGRLKFVGEYMTNKSKSKRVRSRPEDGKMHQKITKRIKND